MSVKPQILSKTDATAGVVNNTVLSITNFPPGEPISAGTTETEMSAVVLKQPSLINKYRQLLIDNAKLHMVKKFQNYMSDFSVF